MNFYKQIILTTTIIKQKGVQMKLHNLFALLLVALVSVSTVLSQNDTKKTDAKKETKQSCCPSDKAAKTGAKVEAKKSDCTSKDTTHKHDDNSDCLKKETTKELEKEIQEKGNIYGCSMCPNVKSDTPGKCPECGMAMEKVKTSEKETKIDKQSKISQYVYVCSMCPDVKADKPGKCPKCGMNLEKLK